VTHIPPGVYPAPHAPAHLQYWNGAEWTAETRPAAYPSHAVSSMPGAPTATHGPAEPIVTAGYILAVLIPIVGFVVGILAAARPNPATNRHGLPIILVSVLSFVVFLALLGAAA
jgi:hypothetical protein